MTEAQKILKMIETVDPEDSDKLDEIDARVWCWLNDKNWIGLFYLPDFANGYGTIETQSYRHGDNERYSYPIPVQDSKGWTYYTRSRDALKAIRPKDWQITLNHSGQGSSSECFQFSMTHWGARCVAKKYINWHWEYEAPTEELAELHAIIQAIECERVNQ